MYKEFFDKYKEDIKKCFKDLFDKDKRVKQIPNLLTASRLLAPLFIVPAAFSGNILLAFLFACGFELTDMFDGIAARKLDAVSDFGKDLDPIVDKISAAGLALPLIFTNPLIILNIISELYITKYNVESKIKGNVPRTTILGKIKTASLSLSFLAAYVSIASNMISPVVVNALLSSTFIIEYFTARQYKLIDEEKDIAKEDIVENISESTNDTNVKTKDLIKKYSRAHNISDLKNFKNELLESKNIEKEKEKTLKR